MWEKPESQHLEGLCAVRSSTAKRLTHYKQGYYSPPSKPIFVPGLQWIGVLLVGRGEQQGPPLLARGKRSSRERFLWDSRRARWVQASVLVLPVCHPTHPEGMLSLVVCRSAGRLPCYLVTNNAVTNEEEAWQVVFAYVRRWHIEQTWRFDKSELAFQSPRVWYWAEREKLLLMASLAYAFLLSLLSPCSGNDHCQLSSSCLI